MKRLGDPQSMETSGAAVLSVQGPRGSQVTLQRSANLRDWFDLETRLMQAETETIRDTTAPEAPRRFYRLKLAR